MKKHGIMTFLFMIVLAVILTGCFKGEQSMEEIDAPPKEGAEAVNSKGEEAAEDEEESADQETADEADTVDRQLYLLDAEGMVVAQTLELPKAESKEVAAQALEHLVKDGPVTPILPNGFQAVLPAGTEVLGIDLKEDGTIIVDVSKEFEEYDAKEELSILEAMTFTLTQFENVDKVKLWINGHPQSEMPVNGTPIGEGYSRANGINLKKSDTVDLIDSQAVTMYFPAENNENRYYVPVTQHVEQGKGDLISSIIGSMLDGPGMDTNVTHVFNNKTELRNKPALNDGVLELVFSDAILKDKDKAIISDEVMETITRTLTEQEGVEAVDVKVEGVEQLVNENEEAYTEPVTKSTFIPSEKL